MRKKTAKKATAKRLKGRAGRTKRSGRVGTIMAVADDHNSSSRLQRWYKPRKQPVTLRLDAEVLDWFQRGGPGYQTRINQALRQLMMRGKGK